MKISNKLIVIILLTVFSLSVTIFASTEISKGAKFHQLNILHLKYSIELSKQIHAMEKGAPADADSLRSTVLKARQQPVDCLALVNRLERVLMAQIGTLYALDICVEDMRAAEVALNQIDSYSAGQLPVGALLSALKTAESVFQSSSDKFEAPVAKTVDFIFATMIPLTVIISLLNVFFIAYLSRSIFKSISDVTTLLETDADSSDIDRQGAGITAPVEIQQLVLAAQTSVEKELVQKEINQELEGLVQERTASLMKANEELTQFSYRASHDLKSPLIAISRLVNCIEQDIAAGDLSEAIENAKKIRNRSTRLSQLVSDIIDLSRADLAEEESTLIDVDALMASVKNAVGDSLQGHTVELHTNNILDKPLHSQPIRLKQVLYNLVTNAIKYADENRDNSFVKVSFSSDESNCFITIEDNGVGIPEKFQKKLFQRFQRFHPKLASGSGLGLAIVKSNIDQLNATVDFSSSPDGTQFLITLPLGKQASIHDEQG